LSSSNLVFEERMSSTFESTEPAVSTRVVQRVATSTNQEVAQLPALYDTIDPDALDAIISSVSTNTSSLTIRFSYSGCQITINGSGEVSVEERN